MAAASTETSSWPSVEGTVAHVMRPVVTTVEPGDHVAAAAYLMKHASVPALVIVDADSGQPTGIITATDIAHVVADGKDVNDLRVFDVMTRPGCRLRDLRHPSGGGAHDGWALPALACGR